jgi:hypothetical protein
MSRNAAGLVEICYVTFIDTTFNMDGTHSRVKSWSCSRNQKNRLNAPKCLKNKSNATKGYFDEHRLETPPKPKTEGVCTSEIFFFATFNMWRSEILLQDLESYRGVS